MAKQVIDIQPQKGISEARSDEHLRRWDLEKIQRENMKGGKYDPSRLHLNFEVVSGGRIVPLDYDNKSIPQRMEENLTKRGITDPNRKKTKRREKGSEPRKYNTVASMIIMGSPDRMNEMAFGNQVVDRSENANNSALVRNKEIEEWAKDMYMFACEKWGEENVIAFCVHLDETTPHIHCTVLPIDERNKFNYNYHFGHFQNPNRVSKIHDDLAQVNQKWGLERGGRVALTGAKHRSTEEYRRDLARKSTELENKIEANTITLSELMAQLKLAERRVKGLTTMVNNKEMEAHKIEVDIKALKTEISALKQSSEKDVFELEKLLFAKERELLKVETALEQKKQSLDKANDTLKMLNEAKEQLQAKYDEAKSTITSFEALEYRHHSSTVSTAVFEEAMNSFNNVYKDMSPEEAVKFEGSLIADLNSGGKEVLRCATLIFAGAVQAAITYSEECGGGGVQSDIPWRDEDETDKQWAKRCFQAANNIMRPSSKRKIKR